MDEAGIAGHRGEIDRIDRELLKLLNERCLEVMEIGRLKAERKLPVYAPERERAVLDALDAANSGPLTTEALHAIYREIMAAARELERPLRVACLGPGGTFSHQAVCRMFSAQTGIEPQRTIFDVFSAVECGRADYGMVPVENSTEGVVSETLDRLFSSTLRICAEHYLPIHHQLAGFGPIAGIERIYSHRQALAQCRNFLQEKFRAVEIVATASTAEAAQMAAEAGSGAAALCSAAGAESVGLPVLLENVEDAVGNVTRFLVIGRQDAKPTGKDKTSLCLGMPDRVGALYDALEPFKDAGISMTMIESRPGKVSAFEYCFFVDILGHRRDENVQAALRAAGGICSFVKVLGSYPRSGNGFSS